MDRINAVLPVELIAKIEEAVAAVRRQGVRASKSSFVEIAAIELLGRGDLAEILRKRGASAKRG